MTLFHHSLRRIAAATTTRTTSTRRLMSTFDKVGVVGLGLMGHGICQVAASASSSIVAFEQQQEFLDRGKQRIQDSLQKMVQKSKLTQDDADALLGRINFTTDIQDLADREFIVEAVVENMDLKRDIYTSLGETCQASTIFASNTSSLSITEMAEFSGRPSQFVGIHFFNPVQLMKLVEVIQTKETDQAVFEKAYNWVGDIGKVAVSCGDTPGTSVLPVLSGQLMFVLSFARSV